MIKVNSIPFIPCFLLLLLLCLKVKAQELILKKDQPGHKAIFFLRFGGQIIDSLTIKNVDYSYYWYSRINDSLYHFIYEDNYYNGKTEANRTRKKQVLLQVNSDKIHVAFINLKEDSKLPYGSLKAERGAYFNIGNFDLDFNLLNQGKLLLNQRKVIINEMIDSLKIDTVNRTLEYNYNKENRVFCTKIDTLRGTYQYEVVKNNRTLGYKEIYFDNEIVPVNNFDEEFFYFFYKDRWYQITGLNHAFTPYREINIDINSLSSLKKKLIYYDKYKISEGVSEIDEADEVIEINHIGEGDKLIESILIHPDKLPRKYEKEFDKIIDTDYESFSEVNNYIKSIKNCHAYSDGRRYEHGSFLLKYTNLKDSNEDYNCRIKTQDESQKVFNILVSELSEKGYDQILIDELKFIIQTSFTR